MLTTEQYFSSDLSQKDLDKAFNTIKQEKDLKEIGYYSLPDNQEKLIEKLYKLKNKVYKKYIKNIVVIGIGGSSLGTKAVSSLLKNKTTSCAPNLIFIENSDPIALNEATKDLKLEASLFVVISKSGSTIETISVFKYVISLFKKPIEDLTKNFVVITDRESALDKFAKEVEIKAYYLYPNVGGRFSVLSAVGLLPLVLAGFDIKKLLSGASKLCNDFFEKKEDRHNMMEKAYFYAKNRDEQNINVLFAYATEFDEFVKWYVQLWAESLGKISPSNGKVGLTPIGIIGSVDQHSFLQLIMEGPKDKTVTFIKVNDFEQNIKIPHIEIPHLEGTNFVNGKSFKELINAQCDSTLEGVRNAGVNTDLITLNKLDEYHIGYLIYYYEMLTSLAGYFLDVNTYDQPGVEVGKKILKTKF
ncbi:MAG: glucose-6-phosphate isomerase [Campylobacterales bacterium]|nr:glucose-6-phosphate isomerase [Campylobacterales bacterium]